MSKKNYTETSIPKQQEPTLPSVRLGQLKGSDNSAVSIGEEALHLRVEYREAEWQAYRLIDLRQDRAPEQQGQDWENAHQVVCKKRRA
jgi:hypothetical protein